MSVLETMVRYFRHGSSGRATHAGYAQQAPSARGFDLAQGSAGQLEHGPQQAGLADRELRGVYAHGQASGAGCRVVAGQCALGTFVELALGGERQGMGGDGLALPQQDRGLAGESGVVHQKAPSRTS